MTMPLLAIAVLGAVTTAAVPQDHPDLREVQTLQAGAHGAPGSLTDQVALLREVLETQSRILPDDHPDLNRVRVDLGSALRRSGALQEARALQEKAVEVFARTRPTEDPHLLDARLALGETRLVLGDTGSARALIEGVVAVRERTLPDEAPALQCARLALAGVRRRLGDLPGARALAESVVATLSRTLPGTHPDLSAARRELARVLLALGDHEGSAALLREVAAVNARTVPADHPELAAARALPGRPLAAHPETSDVRELGRRLPEGSAAATIVRHASTRRDGQGERAAFSVLVLGRDGETRTRHLPEQLDVESLVRDFRARAGTPAGDTLAAALRRAVLDPILEAAGAIDTLYLDGPPADWEPIPWDALPLRPGLVGERVAVVRPWSWLDLPAAAAPRPDGEDSLLVVGDRVVRGIFEAAFPDAATSALASRASKTAVLGEATRVRFVHLALPVWHEPDAGATARLAPLETTGLRLDGARISAEELLRLDLSACALATLTGDGAWSGVRRAGQGCASVAAALRGAGAHRVLAPLWPVDAAEAAQLMRAFYRRLWRERQAPERALWDARMERRAAGAPFRDWAGWMLIGTG